MIRVVFRFIVFALAAILVLVPSADAALTAPTNLHATAQTQTSISVAWSGTAKRYAVSIDGRSLTRVNTKSYTYTGLTCNTTHSLGVRSVQGNQVSSLVTISGSTTACSGGGGGGSTLAPVASTSCTSKTCPLPTGLPSIPCTPTPAAEVIAANQTPNHTVGDGTYTWGPDAVDGYWTGWADTVHAYVQGQQTGTTDELLQWGACRWGFSADLFRAVAVNESDWRQTVVGDQCGFTGGGSYGIMQVKNAYCSGTLAWGGFPDTQQSTALDIDFYGAYMRTCYDGLFKDSGSWLYNGQTVGQIAASHDWDYVVWGCVGSWFSGDWYDSGAQTYISHVQAHLANKDWTAYG